MKTMSDYTLFCTEEQTKKALELGAPMITTSKEPSMFFCAANPKTIRMDGIKNAENNFTCAIPTAEQLIGWLEEQDIYIHIDTISKTTCIWSISSLGYNEYEYGYIGHPNTCNSRKEATIASIDSALEYLKNNKK